ncbi:MAG: hypothetical protein IPM29_02915 [Planctomycetes bacterium]|nr:hypothetical protein [Planctomycetota bacterium]
MRAALPIALLTLLPVAAVPAPMRAQEAGRSREAWVTRVQCADGRYPAAWAEPSTEAPPAAAGDLLATALTVLALLGDGTTTKAGLFQAELQRALGWLVAQCDDRGRLALRTDPDWLLDHAVATAALAEAARLCSDPALRQRLDAPLRVLAGHLQRAGRSVAPECLLWCRIAARSALRSAELRGDADDDDPAGALAAAVDRLAAAVLGVDADRDTGAADDDADARALAVRILLRSLAPDREPGAPVPELERLVARLSEGAWPELTDDPLALWYATLAAYRQGAPAWRAFERGLDELVVRTQLRDGPLRESWAPRGALGERTGRVGTTAVHVLILELYYRYSALEPAS